MGLDRALAGLVAFAGVAVEAEGMEWADDLVASEHVALVVFGHDGRQWRTLKKAPEYYD